MMAMAPANIVCTSPLCLGPPGTTENGDRGANTDKKMEEEEKEGGQTYDGGEGDGLGLVPLSNCQLGGWQLER